MTERQQLDFRKLAGFLPKQVTFLQKAMLHRYMLFGGARGPGKSRTLRWGMLYMLLWWLENLRLSNVKTHLFCETYPELRDRQITKIAAEFPPWLGALKDTQEDGLGFHLHEAYGGGSILLRNLDDPSKYQSMESAGMGVDELTKTLQTKWDVLRGSLRWPGIERPFLWGATNPGGVGHLWVKKLWIDRDFSGEDQRYSEAGLEKEFCFVRALPRDNPYLTKSYWDDLRSQTPAVQKAWIHGDWDAFQGQYFDEWDRTVHVVPIERQFEVPEWWERGAAMDWAYFPGKAVLGLAAFDPHGRAWAYKERVWDKMSARESGLMIADVLEGVMEKNVTIIGDTAMWTPQPDRGVSIAQDINDALADAGVGATLVQANKDRINGWARMHQWLDPKRKNPEGEGAVPWLRFFDFNKATGLGCPYTITTLPAQIHDEKKPGDLLKGPSDHAADMWRYLFMAREPLSELPDHAKPFPTAVEKRRAWMKKKTKEAMELDAARDGEEHFDVSGLDDSDRRDPLSDLWE